MSNQNRMIADATFYLVFLKDIDKPYFLEKIVNVHDFHITPLVDSEVKKKLGECGMCHNYQHITNSSVAKVSNADANIAVLIATLLGKSQLEYGEHEVIAYSCELANQNIGFCLLLDDAKARTFVETHLSYLTPNIKWTSTFICECNCASDVLLKEECFELINDMKNTNSLRVPKWRWDLVEAHIQSC